MSDDQDTSPALGFDFAIDEPPQKLWQALTDPAIVEKWLAPVVHDGDGDRLSCEKLGADEGRNVTYLWRDPDCGDSIVTFSLTERADGLSRLFIRHEAAGRQAPVAANQNSSLLLAA